MRKCFTTLLFLFFTATVLGQQINSLPTLTAADYLKKSKQQKITASVLTGVGTAGLVTTLVADAVQSLDEALTNSFFPGTAQTEHKSYIGYYFLSAAALVGAITLYSHAGNNRKKARILQNTFKMEQLPGLQVHGIKEQVYPKLGVSLSL